MYQWELDRDELGGLAGTKGGAWLRLADGQLGLIDLTSNSENGRLSLSKRGLLASDGITWRIADPKLEEVLDVLTRCSASASLVMGRSLRISHEIACSHGDALLVETASPSADLFRISSCSIGLAIDRLLDLMGLTNWEIAWAPGPWRGFEVTFTFQQLERLLDAGRRKDLQQIRSDINEVGGDGHSANALAVDVAAGMEAFELRCQDYLHEGRNSILRWNKSRLGGYWIIDPNVETGDVTVFGSDGSDVGSKVQQALEWMIA